MAPLRIAAIVLAGLWVLGVATSALGGFVHVLAVVPVALFLAEFVTNRRASWDVSAKAHCWRGHAFPTRSWWM